LSAYRKTKRFLYRALSFSNDIDAARKGPKALARRLLRKELLKGAGRLSRRI
jgi:hypothetical protein